MRWADTLHLYVNGVVLCCAVHCTTTVLVVVDHDPHPNFVL